MLPKTFKVLENKNKLYKLCRKLQSSFALLFGLFLMWIKEGVANFKAHKDQSRR